MIRKFVPIVVACLLLAATVAWAATTPAVQTGSATKPSDTTVLLHGVVNPGGSRTTYSFQYGVTPAYTGTSTPRVAGSGSKSVSVQETLGGLSPGTVYHYRIAATNSVGTTFGADRTFTTTGHPPPGAVTDLATAVTHTTATLTGTVVTQGQTTNAFFEWGTLPTYGVQTPAADVTAASTPTPVSYTLTGLAPGTTFHFRLVAAHSGFPDEYGGDQTFTTTPMTRWHARLTARTTPRRARRKPYGFTTVGTVVPAVTLPPGVGCTGIVRVRLLAGHRTVAFRRLALQSNCTYGVLIGFRHLIDHRVRTLRVIVKFGGNAYLRAAQATTRQAVLG